MEAKATAASPQELIAEFERKRKAESQKEEGVKVGADDFIEGLISSCEYLVSCGHVSEYKDPYSYSLKKLFRLVLTHNRLYSNKMTGEMYAHHFSRIAIASGDQKPFNELIQKIITEE